MLERMLTSFDICNTTGADIMWSDFSECGDLPLSFIFIIAVAAGWGLLFIVTSLRRCKHSMSATNNMVVAKKMQHFQAWFYAFFHTLVYVITLFSLGSLIEMGDYIAALAIFACVIFDFAFVSQIDVLGSDGKKPGVNPPSPWIVGDYFCTSYLAKAVYKTSGHKEFEEEESKSGGCCGGNLNNTISPKVYDIKDVVGIQGAFIGIPTLLIVLITIVKETVVEKVTTVSGAEDTVIFDVFTSNPLLSLEVAAVFISAVLPALLGDWETHSKSVMWCVGSLFLRVLEVIARVGFYAFFISYSNYIGFALLGAEVFFMFLTNISARDVSSAGRTAGMSHFLLSAWLSTFFTNYRRVSVDKDLVSHNTLMPAAIELLRFVVRTLATVVGYIIMATGNLPASYTELIDGAQTLPLIFFAGIVANGILVFFNIINFLVVNKKSVKKSDLGRLKGYWMSLPPCMCLCPPAVVHVNRDNNMGGGINYV